MQQPTHYTADEFFSMYCQQLPPHQQLQLQQQQLQMQQQQLQMHQAYAASLYQGQMVGQVPMGQGFAAPDWQQHQPNQQPEYYGEAGWQEHYDGGAQGSRRGRGRGRGGDEKKRWEDKWQEQNARHGDWDGPKGKQHRRWQGQGQGQGRRNQEPNEAADASNAEPKQSFYSDTKNKKRGAKGKSGHAQMDLVATTETTIAEDASEQPTAGRAWKSKTVTEKKQQAAKEKETEASEKPKGKEKSGGWGDGLTREVRISKTLTQILRHKAVELQIEIRDDGFCSLQKILDCSWLSEMEVTQADVEQVVKKSDKKRFEMKTEEGQVMIRAVQGHSMKVIDDHKLLKEVDKSNVPEVCVHGTYRKHFESIKRLGLLAGGGQGQGFRNHVHFSAFAPGDKRVISGMRYDCEIAIWIDVKKAIEDGVPFFVSTNQVILSPGIDGVIDKKYFKRARDLQKREDLPLTCP